MKTPTIRNYRLIVMMSVQVELRRHMCHVIAAREKKHRLWKEGILYVCCPMQKTENNKKKINV